LATTNKNFRVKNGLEVNSNATVDASGNANIAGNLTANSGFVSADTFRLDTTYSGGSSVVGEFSWDPDNETARLLLDGVNLQIGQEHIVRVKNASGSVAIPDRTVVMFAGATGDTVTVSPANSANVSVIPSDYLVGITTEEIPADGFGFVTQFGFINNVNTAAWTVGTLLYSDPGTAGGLTSTQPAAPGWRKPIAAVTKQNGSAGRILVRALPGVDIQNLENVNFNAPVENDVLRVNSTGIVVNSNLSSANIANLAATGTQTFLGNVTVTSGKQFNGNAAGLTSIPAGNLTGTAANIVYTTTTSLPNVTSVNSTTIPGSSTLLTTSSTLDSSKLNTNTVVTLNATNVAATNVNATTALITGNANVGGVLNITARSGDEGGELFLANAVTNTTITNGVTVDIYQNKLRFFEAGGTARGAYIDLTATASGVGTNLLGSSGAMNYAVQESTKQSGISANATTIISKSFTTNGYPVQVMVTGDAENSTAGGWVKLQLFRDSTAIGKIIHVESSAGSENVPFALTAIDAPAAGTYTYALKNVSAVSTGTMNFGETDGPVLTLIELAGRKGDAGSTGGISSITFSSPLTGGTVSTSGTVGINASSTSTANYVVQRNADGSFSGNVITATTFSGSGASLTSIPNSALTNNSITIGSTSVALGSTITTLPGVTSVNSTTIPGGAMLLTTSNIGSTVQAYDADLTSIAGLANATGYLYNNGSGTFSYATPADTNTTYTFGATGTSTASLTLTPSSGSANTVTITGAGGTVVSQASNAITLTSPQVWTQDTEPAGNIGDIWIDTNSTPPGNLTLARYEISQSSVNVPDGTSTSIIKGANVTSVENTGSFTVDSTNGYVTVPLTGRYSITFNGILAANQSGRRYIRIYKNPAGANTVLWEGRYESPSSVGSGSMMLTVASERLSANDVLSPEVLHQAGTTLTMSGRFILEYLGA
jgi:hypothetical protein